jgi:uncharacterized membrane protein YedE/YeeE
MQTDFTPWSSLLGGILIGFSAGLLLYKNGQIAGISGIVSSLLKHPKEFGWRFWFVAGLIISPITLLPFITESNALKTVLGIPLSLPLAPDISLTTILTSLVGGFMVGFGARLGNGCTSGHGVCGLARLSKRSFVAVGTFMITGALTVFALRHLI